MPILCYHSLDNSDSPISVTPALFRWQMEYLRAKGWRTFTLDEFLQGYASREWPARTCLLTFDDGFVNFATEALPVLAEYGFSATVFVVSKWVGKTNAWWGRWRTLPQLPLMNWSDVRSLTRAGIEIGAHSLSHSRLPQLTAPEVEREIVECKREIEDCLGCAVYAFAYPYGETSRIIEDIVATHFRAGMGTRLGFVGSLSPVAVLERIDAYYLRQPRFFRALGSGWLPPYLSVRQLIRDVGHIGK